MRTTKTVDLGDGRVVTLLELRPKDVMRFLRGLSQDLKNLDMLTLLTERLPQLLVMMEWENITPPVGENLEDLSWSECEAVFEAFREMHPVLFSVAGEMARTALFANFQLNQQVNGDGHQHP